MGLSHITKTSSEKKEATFFLRLFGTLSDLSKARLCLAYFLCLPLLGLTYQTRHSHTHGDGWVWPGHPARLRGVPVRESPTSVSQAAALVLSWTGCGGWTWGQKWAWSKIIGEGCLVCSPTSVFAQPTRETKPWHVLADPCRKLKSWITYRSVWFDLIY